VGVFLIAGVLRGGSLAVHSLILAAIGALVFACGIALAVWARLHLGRNWGMPMTQRAEPELVTSGPYRFVRHPIYTGLLTALLGTVVPGVQKQDEDAHPVPPVGRRMGGARST
jgi:protein-S-isoprenylcysteine O-methyltransferase Ste14